MYTPSQTLQTAMAAGNPQRVLLEFPDEETAFSNEDIVVSDGVRVSASFNGEEELTFGLCPSAQIQFSLLNDQQQLSDFTFGECHAWIGFRIDSGTPGQDAKTAQFTENGQTATYEFIPLGIYIVDRPDVVQKDIIQISAQDRMELFDVEMPGKTDLSLSPSASTPVRLYDLLEAMCTYAGVTLASNSTTFLNYDLMFTSWPSKYFESRTMREVLKWIAEAAGSIARFNRSGELEIAWVNDLTETVVYDEHDYSEFTRTWYETAEIDGLKVRNQGETSESSYGTNPENPYVIAGNPFLR